MKSPLSGFYFRAGHFRRLVRMEQRWKLWSIGAAARKGAAETAIAVTASSTSNRMSHSIETSPDFRAFYSSRNKKKHKSGMEREKKKNAKADVTKASKRH